MDTSKLGNARQLDDNLKAMPGAKPLGDCCEELIGLIEKELIEPSERDARIEQNFSGLTNLESPGGQHWLDRTLALESAVSAIQSAIAGGDLTVWFLEHSLPIQLAPATLENGNVRYGIFKTHQHPEPEMQGAKLWVKAGDWRQFLTTFASGRRGDSESGHFRVGRTFTRDDPATIAPWWTANQALAWIATRIPAYVGVHRHSGKRRAERSSPLFRFKRSANLRLQRATKAIGLWKAAALAGQTAPSLPMPGATCWRRFRPGL